MRAGLTNVDELLARRKRRGRAEAALVSDGPAHRRDPRDGRRPLVQPVAVQPRRRGAAPAGVGVQAVRVPDGLRAGGAEGRHRRDARRRSSTTRRRPGSSTTRSGRRRTTSRNTTDRSRSAARSRTRATSPRSSVAERAGYGNVAALWKPARRRHVRPSHIPRSRSASSRRRRYEIATAYTVFPNMGVERPLRHIVPHRRAARPT